MRQPPPKDNIYPPAQSTRAMQKAQSPDIFEVWEKEDERSMAEVAGWRRDLGFLEAWKRVADRRIHLLFATLPIFGPTLSDKLKKDAVDAIYRHTWFVVCEGMDAEERQAAWLANRDAINEYSEALAEKATLENWKRATAKSR